MSMTLENRHEKPRCLEERVELQVAVDGEWNRRLLEGLRLSTHEALTHPAENTCANV